MKSKSNWSTETPTPGQLKEFFTQIETGDITKKKLEIFLGNGNEKEFKPSNSQVRAEEIMGNNFFGVKDAIRHFGVKPTEEELSALSEVPYSKRILKECKNTHILVAVFPLSILEIREKVDSKLFYKQDWYNDENFAKEKGKVYWKLIRKTSLPDSILKSWKEQLTLLGKDEEAPNARAMVCTIIGHYLKTGERLFEHIYVRASSTDPGGNRVIVGYFGSVGLSLNDRDWGDSRFCHVGVAAARKS